LRHVEDIVRNDIKSLTEVVDSLQRGLSVSSDRIDDLFQGMKNPRKLKSPPSSEQGSSKSDAPMVTTPSPSKEPERQEATAVVELPPSDPKSPPPERILERGPCASPPVQSNDRTNDGSFGGAGAERMQDKPRSPREVPEVPDGIAVLEMPEVGIKPSSPASLFVSQPGLETSLAQMRHSVQNELEQLRASILETVRARIEAGAQAAAEVPVRQNRDSIAMFVKCPPPIVACCASCSSPLSPEKVNWPKEHPMSSAGSFPSRGSQKALPALKRSRTEQHFYSVKVEPESGPARMATYDLSQFIKLPALQQSPKEQKLRDPREASALSKSFKSQLQKQKSLPALHTLTPSIPGVVNLGVDFDRNKVSPVRPRAAA